MKKQSNISRFLVLGIGVAVSAGILACDFAPSENATAKVQVSDIEAYMIEDVAFVTWMTSSESNVDELTLERSSDGKDFRAVSTFKCNGKQSMYTFVDDNPSYGLSYYRIKQATVNADDAIAPLINHDGPNDIDISTKGKTITVSPDHAHDKTYLVSISDEAGKHFYIESLTFSNANPLVINTAQIGLPSRDYVFHVHSTDWSTKKEISL